MNNRAGSPRHPFFGREHVRGEIVLVVAFEEHDSSYGCDTNHVPSLARAFGRRFARALPVHVAERLGMRIVHFAVEGNHVHLIVEAAETQALSRAMQGFSIRVAKGLNAMMHKRGRVLGDRYHARPLRTPTEARRAVAYVRNNHRKHMNELGKPLPRTYVDDYASDAASITLPAPRTWLLRANE